MMRYGIDPAGPANCCKNRKVVRWFMAPHPRRYQHKVWVSFLTEKSMIVAGLMPVNSVHKFPPGNKVGTRANRRPFRLLPVVCMTRSIWCQLKAPLL